MRYHELYQKCLESVPGQIRTSYESGRRPALGYTSNLDVLMRWDTRTFSDLTRLHLRGEPAFRRGEAIGSIGDFVRVVSYLIENGLGGEVEIANGEVCAELERRFVCKQALGGTCAQGAAALACVGVPSVVQISDRSAQVCKWMDYPEIAMVSARGAAVPVAEMVSGRESVKHFIVQYERGGRIQIGERECTIPETNRIIMGYDDLHKVLPVDPHFLSYIEEHAPQIVSYNVSGFNAIVSQGMLRQTVGEMARHYSRVT
jgi:ADP-dependent phosphofructokinase/glucokinase